MVSIGMDGSVPFGLDDLAEVDPGQVVMRLGEGSPVYSVAFDPTGEYLLAGGQYKSIQLFRHAQDKVVTSYAGHGQEVMGLSVSPCGNYFLSGGSDRTAVFWDVKSGRVLRRLTGHTERVNAVGCMPESVDLLLTGSYDRTVRLWDKRTFGRFPVQVLTEAKDSVEALDVRLPYISVASADGFVRTYDIRAGMMHFDAVGFHDISESQEYDAVMQVRAGVDGDYYVASTIGGNIKLVDMKSADILQSFTPIESLKNNIHATGLLFDRNEENILFGSPDGSFVSIDVVTGECKTLQKYDSPILTMDFNKKKNLVAIGLLDGSLHICKMTS